MAKSSYGAMEEVQPFNELQKRLGRKTLGSRILREQPVVLLAYDLLEEEGEDLRRQPQYVRRARLEALLEKHAPKAPGLPLRLSPAVQGSTWQELAILREGARSQGTEGFMLKQRNAAYGVGRTKDVGRWWKWKIDAMSVDAVLIYAQRGHGRRASLYSDYTFAVWNEPPENPDRVLVPFAKAYSGLTDAEMAQVDAIIRKTTRESFGPCAAWSRRYCSSSASKEFPAAAAIKAALRCAFRECCAGARTSRSPRRIRCRRWRRCFPTGPEHCRAIGMVGWTQAMRARSDGLHCAAGNLSRFSARSGKRCRRAPRDCPICNLALVPIAATASSVSVVTNALRLNHIKL